MGLIELFLLAVGLSMDAFAVAICAGLTMDKLAMKKILTVGLYFGIFQAGMPLIGYLLAMQFADHVVAFSPWIAFALLSFLGGKLLIGSLKRKLLLLVMKNNTSLLKPLLAQRKCCRLLSLQVLTHWP